MFDQVYMFHALVWRQTTLHHTSDTLTYEDPSSNGARTPHAPWTSSTKALDALYEEPDILNTDENSPRIDNEKADGALTSLTRYKMLRDSGEGKEPNSRTNVVFAV